MARAHFVKAARKDNPAAGIKKGESYWWWKFRTGGYGGAKHYSKTQPRPSQLTQSAFFSTLYEIEDALSACTDDRDVIRDAVSSAIDNLSALRDETQEKYDNMPEGLQQGDTGQLLEERCSALEDMISELEQIDCDDEGTPPEDLLEAVQAVSYGGS